MEPLFGLDPRSFDVERVYGDVFIRPMTRNDRTEWDRLWTNYLTFYKTTLPNEQYDITFARFLDPSEPMFAYLAEKSGSTIGLVHIILHRSAWMDEPSCYLQDLFVDVAQRGTSTGRKLIDHVYHVVKEAGGSRVHWLTHESNSVARTLYDRMATNAGFIQYTKAL